MDAKITKQRIGKLLSYDWLKIVGIVLAVIFGWSLIFTVTATRALPSQEFTIFNYYCNNTLSETYYTREEGLLTGEKIFSHEVIDVNTYDLAEQPSMYSTLLQTRLSTNEGDLMFVPHVPNKDNAITENGETKYPVTYVESLFSGYPLQFFDIDKYLQNMSAWLDGWYIGGHATGEIDVDGIKEEFITRVTKKKDKRYKTEKQKQTGATLEVERIRKYKTAYDVVTQALADGVVKLERIHTVNKDGTPTKEEGGLIYAEGNYALNLCPNGGSDKMKSWYQYSVTGEDGEPTSATQNMCVMFLDMYNVDDTYEYESLVYVAYIINDCYNG